MNILLIHQYAGNKGDRAVLVSLVHLLNRIFSDSTISVSTSDPQKWTDADLLEHGNVEFCPEAWDFTNVNSCCLYFKVLQQLKKYTFTILRFFTSHRIKLFLPLFVNPLFYEKLKDADVIISVGGHHYTTILSRDLVSGVNYDSMCVMLAGKPLILFSQSFGPFIFHNPRNRDLTQRILNYCNGIYYREKSSLRELQSLSIELPYIQETKETVLALNSVIKEKIAIRQRKKQIGIAIYSTQQRTPEQLTDYCNTLCAFINLVIKDGFSVLFFPMELKHSAPDDRWLIKRIIAMVNSEKVNYIDDDMPTLKHLQMVMECSMFIGHKTHSTIFSIATGTPLIGICYHPKTLEFMKQFECAEYAIVDDKLTTDILYSKYKKLNQRLEEVSEHLFTLARAAERKISDDLKASISKALSRQ